MVSKLKKKQKRRAKREEERSGNGNQTGDPLIIPEERDQGPRTEYRARRFVRFQRYEIGEDGTLYARVKMKKEDGGRTVYLANPPEEIHEGRGFIAQDLTYHPGGRITSDNYRLHGRPRDGAELVRPPEEEVEEGPPVNIEYILVDDGNRVALVLGNNLEGMTGLEDVYAQIDSRGEQTGEIGGMQYKHVLPGAVEDLASTFELEDGRVVREDFRGTRSIFGAVIGDERPSVLLYAGAPESDRYRVQLEQRIANLEAN